MTESFAPQSLRQSDAHRKKSARELGASLVLAIHRLLKVVQIHALDNMAVLQQLDQTTEAIRIFCARTHGPATFLFAKNTVFVSGQLLKASRTEYDAALDLGATLTSVGATELVIQPDVENDDLKRFAACVIDALRAREARGIPRQPAPKIRARRVDAAALLSDDEDLPNDEQIVRTYAQAIVVMRRVIETLGEGRWELPHEAKRIAQKLVTLSEGDTPSFLGVTAMRNANHDAAGRAVNASILAVAMCRVLTDDLSVLARIAMAALLHDVGRVYVLGPERAHGMMRLGDDEEGRMPAAVAFVNTLLGGFRLPSMVRTVIDFEAHWHSRSELLGALYDGEQPASVAARIVATAHRFNTLLTPDPASRVVLTPDEAVAVIRSETREPEDSMVLSLLVGAIGLFPTATIVELSTGERGVVVRSPGHPSDYVRPLVRLVYQANGKPFAAPRELDLRDDPSRIVTRVVLQPDERLRTCRQQVLAEAPKPDVPAAARRVAPKPIETPPPPTPRTMAADSEPPATREAALQTVLPPTRPDLPPTRREPGPSSAPRPVEQPLRHSSLPPSQVSGVRPVGFRVATMPSMQAVRPPSTGRRERSTDVAITELAPPPPSTPERSPSPSEPPLADAISSTDRTPSSISGVFSLITKNVTATARGTLGRTPLAHLIVYVLERRLTGTVVLTTAEESGLQHGIYFERGVPSRVWTPAGVAPLGRMLVELGHLDASQIADPLLAIVEDHEPALEAELLRNGFVTDAQVAEARALQLRRGVDFLFTLRPSTEYAFFADTDLVEGHVGSISGYVPPLELVVAGVRRRADDAIVERVLARLGAEPLVLAQGLRADAFGFDLDEASAFEALALGAPSLPDLLHNPLLDPDAMRRVVYVLLLTRSLGAGDPTSSRVPIENPARPEP